LWQQLSVIETFPQLIGYDPAVYQYFKTQHRLCGYDVNVTYPQTAGTFPTLQIYFPQNDETPIRERWLSRQSITTKSFFVSALKDRHAQLTAGIDKREERAAQAAQWKRDLAGRSNGTIDTWYYCDLFDELSDYAVNFTFPWSESNCIVLCHVCTMLNGACYRHVINCTV
jgi:carboxypeptidase D